MNQPPPPPEHRHDWVWIDRALRGRARASDLSPRELIETVHVLRLRRWSDTTIARWLGTSHRKITSIPTTNERETHDFRFHPHLG